MQKYRETGLKLIIASLLIVSFLAGFLLSPLFLRLSSSLFVPGQIGIIEVKGYVLFPQDLDYLLTLINYAKLNSSIKAVVLDINSGGGSAYAFEQLYYSVRLLAKTKPVVASVSGLAASGGYYLAASADYIYATPSSLVGSIGVIASMPSVVLPTPSVLETGPSKLSGFDLKKFPLQVDEVLKNFINNVKVARGSRLNVSTATLQKAEIYLGSEAKSLGLVDEIGSLQQAVEKAASLAGISSYGILILNELIPNTFPYSTLAKSPFSQNLTVSFLNEVYPPPAVYCLYSPFLSNYLTQTSTFYFYSDVSGLQSGNDVIIDYAHLNAFSRQEIESLLTKIVLKGYSFSFLTDSFQLQEKLANAKVFVVIAPVTSFSDQEVEAIKNFVDRGGKLILISEPLRTSPDAINSIAYKFSLVFSSGYLYNLINYWGIYRFVVVSNFSKNEAPFTKSTLTSASLFRNISKIVVMSSSAVYSNNIYEAAYTDNKTYLAIADKRAQFTPIVVSYYGRVFAIGSLSMFTQPFISLYDNEKLEDNLLEVALSG
ncbi:S49 family peptidase [archaeon]|nr:S49 family peptidase [archaeon]